MKKCIVVVVVVVVVGGNVDDVVFVIVVMVYYFQFFCKRYNKTFDNPVIKTLKYNYVLRKLKRIQ